MATEKQVRIELLADARRMINGLRSGERAVSGFAHRARAEMSSLRNVFGSLQSRLAGMGLSFGAGAVLWQAANLDKSLAQIGQTAGATKRQIGELRQDLFRLGKESGQGVDSLKEGFNVLVQSGLDMKEAKATLEGVNTAMAVTGADARTLAGGLTVAAQAFQFDLAKPGQALELLDRMTVAGRLGNAELENLSDIFSRVGVNAASAGMNFDSTLAFVEGLSKIERQPERLATLADSTLRVFTNLKYMAEAQKATGVKFFDAQGQRRDAVAVIDDIRRRYKLLTTDAERAKFTQAAFGKADLDTIKGIKTLLTGDSLDAVKQFSREISQAGGILKRDMSDATANLVDQAGRLKSALREAADNFVAPINKALADMIRWGMSKSGEQQSKNLVPDWKMIGGGAAAVGTLAVLAKKFGLGGFIKGKLGNAAGIAEGKAVEAATGVTPVFVTNWKDGASITSGIAETVVAGSATKTALGGLAKLAPVLAGALPLLASPVGIAVGGAAAAGGLVWLIKSMMQKQQQSESQQQRYFNEFLRELKQENVINLSVKIDEAGRVVTSSNDMSTRIQMGTLWRGNF